MDEINLVEQAKAEREALSKVLEDIKAERARVEALRAEQILSGKTSAGEKPPEPKKETPPVDYALNALKGKVE